jgi:hypothetical protein
MLASCGAFAPGESSLTTWFDGLDVEDACCVEDAPDFDCPSWVPRSLALDLGCLDSFAGRD